MKAMLGLTQRRTDEFSNISLSEFKERVRKCSFNTKAGLIYTLYKFGLGVGKEGTTAVLCARVSFLNHSCCPNAVMSWDGDRMKLRATEHIGRGDEVTIAYVHHFQVRHKRHTALGFQCRCIECQLTDDDLDASEEYFRTIENNYRKVFAFRERHQMHNDHAYRVTEDAAPRLQGDLSCPKVLKAAKEIPDQAHSHHSDVVIA